MLDRDNIQPLGPPWLRPSWGLSSPGPQTRRLPRKEDLFSTRGHTFQQPLQAQSPSGLRDKVLLVKKPTLVVTGPELGLQPSYLTSQA